MALTAAQRRALPDSAFALPSRRKYPVPTKAQARKAGISETQRIGLHRNALARSTSKRTAGSYPTIARKVKARAGAKVATVGGKRGNISSPGPRGRNASRARAR
jgi:hypothetical protein